MTLLRRLGISFVLITCAHAEWRPNGVDYVMTAQLDPVTGQITGHERVRINNHTGKALDRLYFHVYPNAFRWEKDGTYMQEIREYENPDLHFLNAGKGAYLLVTHISQGAQNIVFQIDKELLAVTLPQPLAIGATTELELDFITQMGAIAERSGVWNGNYSVGQWFPKLMVYDRDGWALEHNRGYHFMGEFYGDFGRYDVELIVPSEIKVGATGHLVGQRDLAGGRKSLHYQADHVHDFAWVADAKFEEQTTHVGSTAIHVLTRHSDSRVIIDYAKAAMEYYNKRIGPYPYADFTVAETYYNGTMEYPQLIFVRSWPAWFSRFFERDILSLLELGVIHETGHQWFYGAVGNNEVLNAWLDEGFTTYLEEAFMRDTHGKNENVIKFTGLLNLTDRELGDLVWRLTDPDVTQPIQTPSYRFKNPQHYYEAAYYKVALFFRHFETLVGREKFDAILRLYYQRNKFHNAVPDDWYAVVHELGGPVAEAWWRSWINDNPKSDYSVGKIKSEPLASGGFRHSIEVAQDEKYFVPVDVEIRDTQGATQRVRAPIGPDSPQVTITAQTAAPLGQVEIDPDHVAPDLDRFNNKPGFFPDIELLPFTTNKLRPDALTLLPLPFVNKRPGIGVETGLFLGAAHYVDWLGYSFVGWDWRHRSVTINATVDTKQPDLSWGWTAAWQRDALVNRGSFYTKRSLGPAVGHDPQHLVWLGSEMFGDLGDGVRAAGLGGQYEFNNLANGRLVRYSVGAHYSLLKNLGARDYSNRVSGKARLVLPLGYRSFFDLKAKAGTVLGTTGNTTLFDLQGDTEGGMRFDYIDIGQFKVKNLRTATLELQFPVPYTGWSDALAFIHGPSWEWHLFVDAASSQGTNPNKPLLVDAGIGTRIDLALGGYGSLTGLGVNLELVPYQNIIEPLGWQSPVFLISISDRL